MNITNIAHFDCAGICDKFKKGFDRYSSHKMRNIIYYPSILEYDTDIIVTENNQKEALKIFDESDIVIFHVVIKEAALDFAPIMDWHYKLNDILLYQRAIQQGKKIIFFLNGSTNLRKYAQWYNDIFFQEGVDIMVSTPDLHELFPDSFYSPVFLDLESEFYNIPIIKTNKLSIGHFPTDQKIKNTEEFVSCLKSIDTSNMILKLIGNMPNINILNIKRGLHLSFDHMQGYYGVNSLESAALACVNFVKLDSFNKYLFCKVAGVATTPFSEVENIDDVKRKIIYYQNNPDKAIVFGEYAKWWMNTYWKAEKHVKRMEKHFEEI